MIIQQIVGMAAAWVLGGGGLPMTVYGEIGPVPMSEVTFRSQGSRLAPSIEGATRDIQFKDFTWNEDGLTGQIQVDLKSLETGMKLRDDHLRDKYLEVQKYPQALLDLQSFPVKEGLVEKEADFTLHGITKKVWVRANWEKQPEGRDWKLKADFKFDLPDFNVETPSFGKVVVAKEVAISMVSQLQSPEPANASAPEPTTAPVSKKKIAK